MNFAKIPLVPKLIYRFNTILIKIKSWLLGRN